VSFTYRKDRLYVEDVPLSSIAETHGTPCYVYSRARIEANYSAYRDAFGARKHQICYSVKANGNLAVLDTLARLGSSFDIVSVGELERVRAAGGDVQSVTFAGVGKTRNELECALAANISCFNVESLQELDLLAEVATSMGVTAPVALRVNPDVDAKTHPYIATGLNDNKFGIPMPDALEIYRRAARAPGLRIVGVACHIGSQLTSIEPIVDAAERVMLLVRALANEDIDVRHIDIGGGLGIAYEDDIPPSVSDYVSAICAAIDPRYEITIEPGRSIVGPAGALLTRVGYIKETPSKTFAICDAAMNDLIRPALYQAHHDVLAVRRGGKIQRVDVVGPVCESGDFLAHGRELAIESGGYLAIMDCGAYGFVMASTYNARPRAAEVIVDGQNVHLARERETLEKLYEGEHRLPSPS